MYNTQEDYLLDVVMQKLCRTSLNTYPYFTTKIINLINYIAV